MPKKEHISHDVCHIVTTYLKLEGIMRAWFHYFSRHQKGNMNCFQHDLPQSYGDAIYIKSCIIDFIIVNNAVELLTSV